MNRIITYIVAAALIIFLILAKIISDGKAEEKKNSGASQNFITADVCIAKDTSSVFKISVPGETRAVEKTRIIGEVEQKITGIFFKEGSFVNKGDILFKLDDSEITAKLEQAEAEEELAFQTELRSRKNFESGGESRQSYDEAGTNLQTIKAEIKYLKALLKKTEIKAPFSGITGLKNVSPGALINPSLVLTIVYDISKLYIDFNIPERYAVTDLKSKNIEFSIQGLKDLFTAKITALEPEIEENTRTLRIRAVVANSNLILKPGLSVEVKMTVDEYPESIFIPSNALMPTLKGYSVYVLRNGKADAAEIETGIRNASSVQVLKGITEGDTVITTNLLRIKEGSRVKPGKIF